MIFGSGMKLSVDPGDRQVSPPSVFLLTSQKSEGSTTACLLKDFYPKDVEVYMNSTTQNSGVIKASPVLSRSGRYSAVHVDKLSGEEVTCLAKHQGTWLSYGDVSSRPPDHGDRSESDSIGEKNECKHTVVTLSSERVNMLSVTVLGLRILFTKTLAFNFLLSAKFFLF
ncbi:hypothetical protein FKM82_028984 [Ascaphus truei]